MARDYLRCMRRIYHKIRKLAQNFSKACHDILMMQDLTVELGEQDGSHFTLSSFVVNGFAD